MRGSFARLAAVSLLLLLGGCVKGTDDLSQWVDKEKHIPGPPLPPLPAIRTFENFPYQDQGGRDPFAASDEEKRDVELAQGLQLDPHPKEKLENYALDSLKMVGTLGDGSKMEALVKDPDGAVNRVHIGNYLGQNNGKVTAISASRIDLTELLSDGNGSNRSLERPTTIELGAK